MPNLEQFTVSRGGAVFKREDFNFWGVTFMPDGDTFYATLSSGGRNYLYTGSVDAKTANGDPRRRECPSLSPDSSRIAFKKRIGGASGWWQLTVLDSADV